MHLYDTGDLSIILTPSQNNMIAETMTKGQIEEMNTLRMKELLANAFSFKSERKQSMDRKTEVVCVLAWRGENPVVIWLGSYRLSDKVDDTIWQ